MSLIQATFQPRIPRKLVPVFSGTAFYRGAYGGRGSAKTRTFAKMTAARGVGYAQENKPGVILCGREFQNSLIDSSMAEVKAAIEDEPLLAEQYDIGEKYIRTKDGRIEYLFMGLRRNVDSIKSTARIRLMWVDEAEPVPESSWIKVTPTLREEDSELWVTWNPERKSSATNQRFRINKPDDAKIVEMNWRDNPWFPDVLNRTRLDDERLRPELYEHIWEGDYSTVHVGAYFAKALKEAERQGRIGRIGRDPLLPLKVFCDLGGAGARADAFSMWVAQFVGKEIRVLDYYEARHQPLAVHVQWLRDNDYEKALIVLPHDGSTSDRVHDISFESSFQDAGFDTDVIPNQGTGAARMRIEASRRLFPSIWFCADKTESGREALGYYHEKLSDDHREIGLGPEHDWCLAAGTQVLTVNGWRDVETIEVGDQVLTPRGARRVLRSGVVRETREWAYVRGIRCTPEHRFFTSRGLVEAGDLLPQDRLWTRGSWGLTILAFSCAILSLGLKTAIISATPEVTAEVAKKRQCSFIGWSTRLFTAKFQRIMKSITSMAIRSTTIPTTLQPSTALSIVAATSPNLGISALAEYAGKSSGTIKHSPAGAAQNAVGSTTPTSNGGAERAYNLTVERDECYFVRGTAGLAYLVSNSSHGADAFGLMCIVYEAPKIPVSSRQRTRRHISYMAA